jgi:hypothetical protein
MAEEQTKPSFWTTLPGILTGVAALITAIGGLIVVVHTFRTDAHTQNANVQPKTPPSNPEGHGQPGPSSVTDKPPRTESGQKFVVIKETDGETLRVFADSLVWSPGTLTPKRFTLKSGQSVPFEEIKTIEMLEYDNLSTSVRVTLVSGETLEGSAEGGHFDNGAHFSGKNDLGNVDVRIGLVKQIVFEP